MSVNAIVSLEHNLPRIMLGRVAFETLAGILRTIPAVSRIMENGGPSISCRPAQTPYSCSGHDGMLMIGMLINVPVRSLELLAAIPAMNGKAPHLGQLLFAACDGALIGTASGLPQSIGTAISSLLQGNLQKVMISMALWLPYLILSDRVNLTYRGRIASGAV